MRSSGGDRQDSLFDATAVDHVVRKCGSCRCSEASVESKCLSGLDYGDRSEPEPPRISMGLLRRTNDGDTFGKDTASKDTASKDAKTLVTHHG